MLGVDVVVAQEEEEVEEEEVAEVAEAADRAEEEATDEEATTMPPEEGDVDEQKDNEALPLLALLLAMHETSDASLWPTMMECVAMRNSVSCVSAF